MELKFQHKISKEQVMNLPVGRYEGEITCIDNRESFIESLPYINKQRILGFDTETKPSFKKGRRNPVALIQLATEYHTWLIRLNRMGYVPELWELFTGDRIKKIGIGIRDDLRELKQIHRFEPSGFIELQNYVKDFGIEDASLVKITAQILGFRVSKSQRLSNWEMTKLSPQQQAYAATDAWVCYLIYRKLSGYAHGTQ